MFGKTVFRSASAGALLVPTGVPAGNYLAASGLPGAATVENPACVAAPVSAGIYAWALTGTTAATVGLPVTITPPLVLN